MRLSCCLVAGTNSLPVANAVAVPADVLLPNTKVMFRSRSSGKFLRIIDGGLVDAKGNHDNYSKFIVDPSPRGYLRLRNVHNGERFLALRGGQATSGIPAGIPQALFCVVALP